MLTFFSRLASWLLKTEEALEKTFLSPRDLVREAVGVHVLLAHPFGKFRIPEERDLHLGVLQTCFTDQEAITLTPVPVIFKRNPKGSLEERFREVNDKGRQLIKDHKADLLMWGELEKSQTEVRWFFLSAKDGEVQLGSPGKMESLVLALEPEKPSLDVLQGVLLAATKPDHPSHALKIGESLLSTADRLLKIPQGLTKRKTTPAAKISTLSMCATVLANIARRAEGTGWFEPAIQAFERWEAELAGQAHDLDWAFAQVHRAWLYGELAERCDETDAVENIEKALGLFEQVLGFFNQKSYPLEWASVHLRMGNLCAWAGRKLSDPEYLQRSARYFHRALEAYSQEKYPLNWADVTTRMAKSMMLHGQMVKGAQSLEKAGIAFQAILKVYTLDKYPAQWASTQNNLGATLFALFKRDPRTPQWLEHAILCFDAARKYYAEQGKVEMVHVIEKNLQKAQSLKEEIAEANQQNLLK